MFNQPSLSKSPPPLRAANSPRSPALAQFEDPPAEDLPEEQQPHIDEAAGEDEIPYPEYGSDHTLLPPPNFRPFFALVEDAASGEHYHPYIHYVFADDDPVAITAATMRGMGLDDTKYLPHDGHEGQDHMAQDESQESPVESPLPPPIPGMREHYLIIDVGADGRTVVDAQSLSSSWQITNASTRTAPSFDESSADQGLMLRIEGVEIPGKKKGKAKGQPGDAIFNDARDRSQGDAFAALDGLVEGIEASLMVASKITGFGSREKDEVVDETAKPESEEKNVSQTDLPLDFDRTGYFVTAYELQKQYDASNFFDSFDFINTYDTYTHGRALYVAKPDATSMGLARTVGDQVFLGVDNSSIFDVAPTSCAFDTGCGTQAPDGTFGDSFNKNGGGIWATQIEAEGVRVWYFPRSGLPADLESDTPNPDNWGAPVMSFVPLDCDIRSSWKKMKIIINITFCGEYAGGRAWDTYTQCRARTGVDTCDDYVAQNPSAFDDVYFLLNSIKTYNR
ncbi:hypothetical protein E8E13_004693 [Curvularia kusanoi]|uniref:Uncharacterized protein n=1 Tax=Curvularia kusanoi TaxID=90978 RepID=A0A9P4WB19_CURKU|nr:hypothetical protein E8E13_004693 [Curvularia kusanoi]